jgi:hypothetical protein
MHRTQPDKSLAPEFASAFNVRQNWHHLTRRPAHQEPVIDGVRAIAILWVVILHIVFFQYANFPAQVIAIFNGSATGWIKNGTLGVDLFFVISGFLMGSILFSEFKPSGKLELTRFYVRRFLRLSGTKPGAFNSDAIQGADPAPSRNCGPSAFGRGPR